MSSNLVPSSHGLSYRPGTKRSKLKKRFVAVAIGLVVEFGLTLANPQLGPILLFADVVIIGILLIAKAMKTRRH